jgi:hypothetical protein
MDLPLDPPAKRRHVGALIKLSRASGLYPECMILRGIKLVGGDAVAGGGYGEVSMQTTGYYEMLTVAVL